MMLLRVGDRVEVTKKDYILTGKIIHIKGKRVVIAPSDKREKLLYGDINDDGVIIIPDTVRVEVIMFHQHSSKIENPGFQIVRGK